MGNIQVVRQLSRAIDFSRVSDLTDLRKQRDVSFKESSGQNPKPPPLADEPENFMQAAKLPDILQLVKKPPRFVFVASRRKKSQL